ncbi:MAG: mechanosensitive ion channel [Bacteroidia bacterium]|nr:mechanosensitive ion channel [Bacteroidia bacterium]
MEISNKIIEPEFFTVFKQWLIDSLNFTQLQAIYIKLILSVIVLIILSVGANYVAKGIILTILRKIIRKSKTLWDDILLEFKVFHNLSHIAPALVIYCLAEFTFIDFPAWIKPIRAGTYIYLIVIGIVILLSFFKAVNAIYQSIPSSKNRSIKGYIQILNVFVVIVGGILIISILFGKNPTTILAGLGVFIMALMFVFKDTLLGLAGGIQLAANDMVRPGDWIEMSARNADGIVLEIGLNTIKVQNWDNAITTIPTYALVSESFKNWRGMQESGARRICRAIYIDIKSIKFCTCEMLEKFKKIHLISNYIEEKLEEIKKYNKEHDIDASIAANGRKMTNIGAFRKYTEAYLQNNPNISKDLIFVVRQLEPTANGLPLQIYVFSKIQAFKQFEEIQSDIFDHILTVVPEFELRLFQNPTGEDFQKLEKHTEVRKF